MTKARTAIIKYGPHNYANASGPFYVDDWSIRFVEPKGASYHRTVFMRTLGSARKAALRIAKMLRKHGFPAKVQRAELRAKRPRRKPPRRNSRRNLRRRTSRR